MAFKVLKSQKNVWQCMSTVCPDIEETNSLMKAEYNINLYYFLQDLYEL